MLVDWQAFDVEAEERRKDIIAQLEWPEVAAVTQLEREDEKNRRALASYGFVLP